MDAFKNSIEYNDALDRREAQERAEQAERELNTSSQYSMCPECSPAGGRHYDNKFQNCMKCGASLITPQEPLCICLEIIGDNGDCPVHGKGFEQAKADYFTDYGADYQERNDLYSFAMGC